MILSGKGLDEVISGRAGAEPKAHTRLDKPEGRMRCGPLKFVG
jgi:hypothetical protein